MNSVSTASIDKEVIPSSRVILCEGSGDKNVLNELIARRELPDYYITHPREGIDPGGRSGFASRLRGLRLQHGFDAVRGILVVSDNDDNEEAKFKEVRKLILEAEFQPPNRAYVVHAGPPAMAVMMIPQGECGQLETLCLRAIEDTKGKEFQCAQRYGECMGITGWSQGKRERAMLRSLISHICRSDPNTSLSHLWHGDRETVFSVMHPSFDHIARFMSSFDKMIDSAR